MHFMSEDRLLGRSCRRLALLAGLLALLAGCASPPLSPPPPPAPPVGPPLALPPQETPPALPPPRLGLALGGGAARGFAHIGVIQVLEAEGIPVHCVVGTSAGSLVAAMWASGKSGTELASLARSMDESAISDWTFTGRGLLRGEALARYVREHTEGKLIEGMVRPLGIVATDLGNGEAVLFRRGDPGTAVRASSAVPAVFMPVRINGREYVDGGLVAPVPVRFARQMGAELVLAVDISAAPEGQATGDPLRMLLQTFAIMGRSLNRWELQGADLVLRPALDGLSGADFTQRQRAIDAGRDAARAALPALRRALRREAAAPR